MTTTTTARQRFLSANREFFKARLGGRNLEKGLVLVDPQSTSEFFLTEIMKISAALRDAVHGDLVVLSAIRTDATASAIVKSYRPRRIISIARLMLDGLLRRGLLLVRAVVGIRTGNELVQHREAEYEVGPCIYDAILRRLGLASIAQLMFKQRFYVLMELSYFHGLKRFVERNRIAYAVLPDNAYRNGLLFEIARVKALPSIVGIDLNGMSMHRYAKADDYVFYCRTPDEDIVQRVAGSDALMERAEQYLRTRTAAKEKQHDVMRAYSAGEMIDRDGLSRLYGMDPARKNVLVMAHIFCDAPHAYPGMLFTDFEDWLVQTCARLSRNDRVNYVVKEHPSAALYREEGLTQRILERNGFRGKVLSGQVNTKSLFHCIDAMITCGGTSGMEFPCFGVPVLVAARPPYCYERFIRCPSTVDVYLGELDRIHEYEKQGDQDRRRAMAVLYVIQSVMKVPRERIGLGTHDYYMGSQIDMKDFFREMEEDCHSGNGYKALVSAVDGFVHGPYANFMQHCKYQESCAI